GLKGSGLKRCVQCASTTFDHTVEEEVPILEAAGTRFVADLEAQKCRKCGEVYIADAEFERAHHWVAERLVDLGVSTGDAFRFLRKTLGMRAIDLAELLTVDAVTISRWETGASTLNPLALATLGMLVLDELTRPCDPRKVLEAQAHPQRLPR